MSFYGTRRHRQARVFRPTPGLWDRLLGAFRDYRVLTLVLISTAAVCGLLLAAGLGSSGQRWREGMLASSGIQARVDFRIVDTEASRRARQDAVETAPLVLRQSGDIIDRLESLLRTQLSVIANTDSINQVSEELLSSFGIRKDGSETERTAYSVLRNQLSTPDDSNGRRLDELIAEFSQFISDARRLGLIDRKSAVQQFSENPKATEAERDRAIQVIDAVGTVLHNGVLSDVLLEDQLQETGRLGKNWQLYGKLAVLRKPVEAWLLVNLNKQLARDAAATEAARRKVEERTQDVYREYSAGDTLVPPENQILETHREVLRYEQEAFERSLTGSQRGLRFLGRILLTTVLVLLFGIFLKHARPGILEDPSRLLLFLGMCCSTVFLGSWASQDPYRAEVIPLLAAVMITAIVYGQAVAIMTAFVLTLLLSASTTGSLSSLIVLMIVSVASVLPLRRIKSRLIMIKLGFRLAAISFVAVWSAGILEQASIPEAWKNSGLLLVALKYSGSALICCYLVAGSLPFIEQAFGIVTDISLLELTGVSHPLLQELARRAPGTYNHSMMVAAMAEAAAESIGANGLLTRVGAYFHDIGKMMKPEYFIENITEGTENPHKSLAPNMSTLIIIGHVKDGLELAEENNLPEALHPFIAEHHGTTLVEYFYREAARKADSDHRSEADESNFRYPGPRPQTREAAVLMVADAVESASRTLNEPTSRRIQSLVHDIILKRLLDGQFDDCNLQMNELRRIEESLVKSLLAAHHGRVRYPGQRHA